MTASEDFRSEMQLSRDAFVSAMGQLDVASRAQLPLGPALTALAEEAQSSAARRALRQLARRVEQGESLPEALASTPTRLSPALLLLAERGLQFGRFDSVLHWTVEQTRRSNELRRQLWFALAYPVFLLAIAVGVASFVLFYIVPQFAKIFEDFGTELPSLTQAVVFVSRIGVNYWLPCLGVLLVLLILVTVVSIGWGHWLVTRRWSGSIPLIGPLFRMAALTEFCHLLAVFIEAQMPLATSVRVAAESSEDQWLRLTGEQLALDIERGIGAEMAALTCGLPSSLAHVLRETSSPTVMADALHGLGDIYAARTEVNARLTSTVIEPFAMIFTVVGLGTIVIALFLPLFKLLNELS